MLRTFPGATSTCSGMTYCDGSTGTDYGPSLPGSVVVKCHRAHRFSRREQWRRYRNLIKASAPSFLRTQRPIATGGHFADAVSYSGLSREQRGMGSCVRRNDVTRRSPQLPFMKSLFLRPSPPLVFKWRSGQFCQRGCCISRTKSEMTPCRLSWSKRSHHPRRPAPRCLCASPPNSCPTSSTRPAALSVRGQQRQSRPCRAADPVAGMDRRGAGADRSGIAAMAAPPPRL